MRRRWIHNRSIDMDGLGDCISIPGVCSEFSFLLRFKPERGKHQPIVSFPGVLSIGTGESDTELCIDTPDSTTRIPGACDGAWHTIVVSMSGEGRQLLFDCKFIPLGVGSAYDCTAGWIGTNGLEFADVTISEVAIWNKPLRRGEMLACAKRGLPCNLGIWKPKHWYRYEGVFPELTDYGWGNAPAQLQGMDPSDITTDRPSNRVSCALDEGDCFTFEQGSEWDLSSGSGISVSCWVKRYPKDMGTIISQGEGSWSIEVTSESGQFEWRTGGINAPIKSILPLDRHEWTHIVVTYSNSEKLGSIYVNGLPSGCGYRKRPLAFTPEDVPRIAADLGMRMGAMAIWCRPLRHLEIEALAANPQARLTDIVASYHPTCLFHYWDPQRSLEGNILKDLVRWSDGLSLRSTAVKDIPFVKPHQKSRYYYHDQNDIIRKVRCEPFSENELDESIRSAFKQGDWFSGGTYGRMMHREEALKAVRDGHSL